jgi:hypothetical protein
VTSRFTGQVLPPSPLAQTVIFSRAVAIEAPT